MFYFLLICSIFILACSLFSITRTIRNINKQIKEKRKIRVSLSNRDIEEFLSHALLYILSSSTPLKNFSANPVIFQKQCEIFRSAQWPVYNFNVKFFPDHLTVARRVINVLLFAADQFSYFGSSDGILHHCPILFA